MFHFTLPDRKILGRWLLLAASTWAFFAIADRMVDGDSGSFDRWVLCALRRPENLAVPIGPAWLPDVARDVSALGGTTVIALVTFSVLGFLWLKRKGPLMGFLGASILGGTLLSAALKHAFSRERPTVVPHLVQVSSLSFPSGHSMLSAVTYITMGVLIARMSKDRATRIYALGLALILTCIIGLSRIYLGVHYPTDVLAGWCAGMAWATLCASLAKWLQARGKKGSVIHS